MTLPIPALEAARFFPEVPRLFRENQARESPAYEDVIYRVASHATSADVERALRFLGSKATPPPDVARSLNRVLEAATYPSAGPLVDLRSAGLNLPEAVSLLHFFRPAYPLYREPAVRALSDLGFSVSWRIDLSEDGVGAYEGFVAAVDMLKARIPYAYVPESNCFLSRLIEGALMRRGAPTVQ